MAAHGAAPRPRGGHPPPFFEEQHMNTLSLDAAVALTGISRSTLWRRVTDGALAKGDKDARGRATLALADVLGLLRDAGLADALGTDDLPVLLRADAGDAEAQADVGALLYLAGAERAALYWLNEAALQGSAEAMQWLGTAHAGRASAGGGGRPRSARAGCQPGDHVDRAGCGAGPPRGAAADGRPAPGPGAGRLAAARRGAYQASGRRGGFQLSRARRYTPPAAWPCSPPRMEPATRAEPLRRRGRHVAWLDRLGLLDGIGQHACGCLSTSAADSTHALRLVVRPLPPAAPAPGHRR